MKVFLILSVALKVWRCPAQSPGFVFQHLRPENGLSQVDNNFIYQDSRGFVWVGSLSGLNRFDGQHVRTYQPDPKDPGSIRGNNIQSQFYEDTASNLWFSTYDAVNCYVRRDDCFRSYRLENEDGKPYFGYYVVGVDKSGIVWVVAQPNKLYSLDPNTGAFRFQVATAPETNRGQLLLDQKGKPERVFTCSYFHPGIQINWVGEYAARPPKAILSGTNKGHPSISIQGFWLEGDSILWFAGNQHGMGCYDLRDDTYRLFEQFDKSSIGGVSGISFWGRDHLLVATQTNGLLLFDRQAGKFTQRWRNDPANGLSIGSNALNSIYGDNDGNFWLNVANIGLDFFRPEKIRFQSFLGTETISPARQNYPVGSLLETSDGRVWCTIASKSVWILDEKNQVLERIENQDGKSPNLPHVPMNLVCDAQGRVWVLSWFGLGIWEPDRHRFRTVSKQGFLCGLLLKNGTLLLCDRTGGIFALREKPKGRYSLEAQHGIDPKSAFSSIHEDSKGRLWVCKNAADMLLYEPVASGWRQLRDLGVNGETKAYHEDSERNEMWLATSIGLANVDLDDFKSTLLTERDGLPNPTLYSVLPDAQGFLWISSNRGISRFDLQTRHFKNFDRTDGLPAQEFNSFGFLKKKNGAFWFGSQQGGVLFFPDSVRLLATSARPSVTAILVNDSPDPMLRCARTGYSSVSEIQSLDLDYRHNTLSFEFAALEYSNPGRNLFRYQMEGIDIKPVEAGTRGFARYADLRPGQYTLLVWAANSDAVWNPTPLRLDIRIQPPFWMTWWFICLMALLALLLAYALYRYRIAQLRREFNLRQAVQESELKATESDLKAAENELKSVASEMKALRAQMNPHFLFNALNSINGIVLMGNTAKANELIGQFSRLMRGILEHSSQNVVPLADELELLELYIQIEQHRFSPPFTYEIRVSPEIDSRDQPMPTMILQPFVENAIWHGLQHLPPNSRQGHIRILVDKSGEQLHCTIEDNGAGRALAAERRDKNHRSQGTDITAERLRLLPGQNRSLTNDLYEATGQPAGTKVDIWLAG